MMYEDVKLTIKKFLDAPAVSLDDNIPSMS